MSVNYVQANTLYLAGSGTTIGATTITLTSLTDIYGNVLTMSDFGSKGYITLEPDTTNEEAATFTGVTANANGTYTLTGVSTALAKSPYTETSGLVRSHAGGTKVVITDNVAFWNTFVNKGDNGTITSTLTFSVPNYPQVDTPATLPTLDAQFATKKYVDGVAIAGAPDASTTTKGISTLSTAPVSPTAPIAVGDNDGRVPTQGENDALVGNNTDIAVGTSNKFVTQTGLQHSAEVYAASVAGTDTYVITLSPIPTSYTAGMMIRFKADVANTGPATLNVNSLGAKTIKKNGSVDLNDNDIVAGQVVTVVYDGTNFQLVSKVPSTKLISQSSTTLTSATGDANEHNFFSITLPANTLSTGNVVRVWMNIQITNNSGAGNTTVLRGKYGGSTVWSATVTSAANTTNHSGEWYFDIYATGATNTQSTKGRITCKEVNLTMDSGSGTGIESPGTGATSAVDSTADQTLLVSYQHGSSSAACVTVSITDYFVEVLGN